MLRFKVDEMDILLLMFSITNGLGVAELQPRKICIPIEAKILRQFLPMNGSRIEKPGKKSFNKFSCKRAAHEKKD
ncbi:hypothetical protein KHA96_07860 [Bacillus sp. FJAT-49711]|uniref:hypothetical protein n=1 Tax=Bacillus sp. FJAT-49711 TaxID=2833585 RepID=UPI001BC9F5F9|nr:hypothetical protein [Bacillus sp. FJAT-49711]MBS4218225.1 hypothetical protein [Bacillus sp. FJAT-49711]